MMMKNNNEVDNIIDSLNDTMYRFLRTGPDGGRTSHLYKIVDGERYYDTVCNDELTVPFYALVRVKKLSMQQPPLKYVCYHCKKFVIDNPHLFKEVIYHKHLIFKVHYD
jgi:hypothetical protein